MSNSIGLRNNLLYIFISMPLGSTEKSIWSHLRGCLQYKYNYYTEFPMGFCISQFTLYMIFPLICYMSGSLICLIIYAWIFQFHKRAVGRKTIRYINWSLEKIEFFKWPMMNLAEWHLTDRRTGFYLTKTYNQLRNQLKTCTEF